MKEEKSIEGNQQKMREALIDACYAMFNFLKTQSGGYEEMAVALDKAKAALSAPPRNCDVGTAEEQYRRWIHFCEQRLHRCDACEINSPVGCTFKFGDMPYEAEEGNNG